MSAIEHVLVVLGTRPEAVKLAPLIAALRQQSGIRVTSCATAQHRELLDSALASFGLVPDIDLDLMVPDQELGGLTARILGRMREVLPACAPDLVVVQGDTTSAMSTALAAHYANIPIAHVEAGLRTSSVSHPWPEEANRRIITRLATTHFAATEHARENLLREGIDPSAIHVVGNTGLDAARGTTPRDDVLDRDDVLVTCHRRENQADDFTRATDMLRTVISRFTQRNFVLPLHPSPRVREPMTHALSGLANLRMIEPLDYASMLGAIRDAHMVITDSGGVQEEAAWFGTPCLVARDETDRPESVQSGQAWVVGVDPAVAVAAFTALEDDVVYNRAARRSTVFGDGYASEQIVRVLTGRSKVRTSAHRGTRSNH